jgi:hypothetical protein
MTQPDPNKIPSLDDLLSGKHLQFNSHDVKRWKGQCDKILERLKQGPLSLSELRQMGANHTARISNLRKAGHNIPEPTKNQKTGETLYVLLPGKWPGPKKKGENNT